MPGAVPWVMVGGTSQQAASNTAYLVTGGAPTTITLPVAPVVGDTVKVSAQTAGSVTLLTGTQSVIGGGVSAPGFSFTSRDSVRSWQSVASSADGTKLVAVAQGDQIYTSTDSGATWNPRDSARVSGQSVASSADGTKLVAVEVQFAGQIYTSTDSGRDLDFRATARESGKRSLPRQTAPNSWRPCSAARYTHRPTAA